MSQAFKTINAVIASAFLLLFPALAAAARSTKSDLVAPGGHLQRSEIPIHILRGYLVVVEGDIGELHHQNLLVDTGTSPSIIHSEIAQKLGLIGSSATISLPSARTTAEAVFLPELAVGPLHAAHFPVMVHDLSLLRRELGVSIAGIIGLDVLGQTNFQLDFSGRRLVFGAVREQGIPVPFGAGPPSLVTVSLTVGRNSVRVLVDTGAAGLLFFRNSATERLPLVELPAGRTGNTIGGEFRVDSVSPGEIVLGGKRFHLEKAYLARDSREGFDGLLGVSAMGFKSIAFDFDSKMIYLQN